MKTNRFSKLRHAKQTADGACAPPAVEDGPTFFDPANQVRDVTRNTSNPYEPPKRNRLSEQEHSATPLFVSLFLGVLSAALGWLCWVSAGAIRGEFSDLPMIAWGITSLVVWPISAVSLAFALIAQRRRRGSYLPLLAITASLVGPLIVVLTLLRIEFGIEMV